MAKSITYTYTKGVLDGAAGPIIPTLNAASAIPLPRAVGIDSTHSASARSTCRRSTREPEPSGDAWSNDRREANLRAGAR